MVEIARMDINVPQQDPDQELIRRAFIHLTAPVDECLNGFGPGPTLTALLSIYGHVVRLTGAQSSAVDYLALFTAEFTKDLAPSGTS